jgi:hypothetical protein
MTDRFPLHSSSTTPTIGDVFASFPGDRGALAAAVEERVQAVVEPLVPVHVSGFEDEPYARPLPYRDSAGWSWVKHLVQAALVAAVLMFVTNGGNDPVMGASYVLTALLLLAVVTISDRQRFADRDPSMLIVEVVQPQRRPAPAPPPVAPLVPLVEQMQHALHQRVDVT